MKIANIIILTFPESFWVAPGASNKCQVRSRNKWVWISGINNGVSGKYFSAFCKRKAALNNALSLQQIIPIELNYTFLVIGKIIYIQIDNNVVSEDDFLHLVKQPLCAAISIDGYYTTELIKNYSYAKPGIQPQKIS